MESWENGVAEEIVRTCDHKCREKYRERTWKEIAAFETYLARACENFLIPLTSTK